VYRSLFFKHLAQTSDFPLALEINKAQGSYIYTSEGKKYLDLISGISVSNVGHSNPYVIKAITEQASKYMHIMVYGETILSPQVTLAKQLSELTNNILDNIYFVNTGSEAIEGAIKIAKKFTNRPNIIAFKNAYHGSSNGALSLMGNKDFSRPYRPLMPGVFHYTFNNEEVFKNINNKVAAVIIEPIQGEAGAIPAEKAFLQKLREVCSTNNTLLIFDEIQSGIGRTGKFFAYQHYDIVPDILCLAKALGGGLPLGAFLSSKKIMSVIKNNPILGHITTFGGHPVSCSASIAAIKFIIENELIIKATEKEQLFRKYLKHNKIISITGKGLLLAVNLPNPQDVQDVISHCINNGVLTDWFLFNDSALRIAPPLTINDEEIKFACQTILYALN